MEFLPVFINKTVYFDKTCFDSKTESRQLFEIVRDCINGSCSAIIVNEEIIYNNYDPTRIPSRVLMEDVYKQQFAKYPHLLIQPYKKLKIMICMFYDNPWSMIITFNDGYYNIECFSN
jgi:hypothetical protein